jgi:phage terminase large subunit
LSNGIVNHNSGKSFNAALMAALWGYAEPLRILCIREFQASIQESFYAELKAAIEAYPWLEAHYDVGVDYIKGRNGTKFIFRGIRRNPKSIKSTAGVDLTIVEEAEDVPESSWLDLEATVFRKEKSELWALWNPRLDGSPVDNRFRKSPPESSLIAEVNWNDNPYFPKPLGILRKREQERLDPNTYAHVWEGTYLENSDSQIFANKYEIKEFEPEHDWNGPYQGLDFGFAQDPTAAVRAYVYDDCLWIRNEAGKIALELDDTAEYVETKIPGFSKSISRADNARPESISYLSRHGMPRITAVKKWKGSVEDGIEFMKSYRRIYIHPECKQTIKEFRLYSYKVDKLSGDVLAIIVDANNHFIDAIRYALGPLMKQPPKAGVFIKSRNR